MALIVPVTDVARRLGLTLPLDDDDAWLIEQALIDAQSDLEAYLGRPVTPQTFTETGLIRFPEPDPWQLANYPVVAITTVTPETHLDGQPTGRFTVTYVAGLDGADDPELEPLRRFVRTHAIYSPDIRALYRRLAPEQARQVASLSVEGQAVTYTDTFAASGQPGAPGTLPTLASCDRWRIAGRRVFQRRTPRWRDDWYREWPYEVSW